jgi:hypothetical protein
MCCGGFLRIPETSRRRSDKFRPGLRNGPMNRRLSPRRLEADRTSIERLLEDTDANGGQNLGSSELR